VPIHVIVVRKDLLGRKTPTPCCFTKGASWIQTSPGLPAFGQAVESARGFAAAFSYFHLFADNFTTRIRHIAYPQQLMKKQLFD
jgi:hypothetical protein